MADNIYYYLLNWAFVVGSLLFSWKRSGHYLHPHFMFTVMLCVYVSDFLVRGYSDDDLGYIPLAEVHTYQVEIIVILTSVTLLTSFFRSARWDTVGPNAARSLENEAGLNVAIFMVAFGILLFELFKRFSTVGWSLEEVIRQSLLPRGQREWELIAFTGNFLFSIATILLPIAAMGTGYLQTRTNGIARIINLVLFCLIIALLVTNGSRTPVALSVASLALFWTLRQRSLLAQLTTVTLMGSVLVILFSLMIYYRSIGYLGDVPESDSFGISYQQDDNYYRTIFAYFYSDYTGKSWDPSEFISAILANPIPRVFWEGKPLLDAQFYDGFKLDYVTNSFLGEIVAMTGTEMSMVVAPFVAIVLYLILFLAVRLLRYPMGLAAYLIVALYVYMCVRSLLNITQFMYLPAATVLIVLFLNARAQGQGRSKKRFYG